MASKKIQGTTNYAMFHHSPENRLLNLKKHRRLEMSMRKHGFIAAYAIICVRDKQGRLIVKDGQHRLAIAQLLGLKVYWVEEEVDFDVAEANLTACNWVVKDYAEKHAANGIAAYQEGLEFAKTHGLTISAAFGMLAGTISFTNCRQQYLDGEFKIKDREWAASVASLYAPMVKLSAKLKTQRFIEACMSICRVPGFDHKRMLSNAERYREKLVSYSTKDAYMGMIEDIYNAGRKQIVALKIEAIKAMRGRNFGAPKKPGKEAVA